ncbi:hypothetical protein [Streptomyces sp. NPDC003032]
MATYLNGVRLAQRQERLLRVNRQLSDFYGPLFALAESNARTFATFMERHARPDGRSPFAGEVPPTEAEAAEWRLWATTVFIPNIREMRDVIVQNADLLREPAMPAILLRLCEHVSGYEIRSAHWSQGRFDKQFSVVAYPGEELGAYARDGFTSLKEEQARLLRHR